MMQVTSKQPKSVEISFEDLQKVQHAEKEPSSENEKQGSPGTIATELSSMTGF